MPDLDFLKKDSEPSTEPKHKKSLIPAKFQKLLKYKWFVVGLGVVVILGFYALLTRKSNSVEDVSSDAGYLLDTYPSGSGGSYTGLGSIGGGTTSNDYTDNSGVSDNDIIDTVNDNLSNTVDNVKNYVDNSLQNMLDQIGNRNDVYDTTNSNIISNLDTLNEKIENQNSNISKQSEKISTDSVINAMKQNSELWNIASDPAQKQLYSDTNKKLAEQIGAVFDSVTGNWKDSSGSILYYSNAQMSALDTVQTMTGKSASSQTVQDYIKTMQANSLKYKNATNDAERQKLAKENETLGSLAGLTKDSASGKWYTASGADAWDYTDTYVAFTSPNQTTTPTVKQAETVETKKAETPKTTTSTVKVNNTATAKADVGTNKGSYVKNQVQSMGLNTSPYKTNNPIRKFN